MGPNGSTRRVLFFFFQRKRLYLDMDEIGEAEMFFSGKAESFAESMTTFGGQRHYCTAHS